MGLPLVIWLSKVPMGHTCFMKSGMFEAFLFQKTDPFYYTWIKIDLPSFAFSPY